METKIGELKRLLAPIVRFVEVNDGDTMSRLSGDEMRLATASGSWTGCTHITWGDLRKIVKFVKAL